MTVIPRRLKLRSSAWLTSRSSSGTIDGRYSRSGHLGAEVVVHRRRTRRRPRRRRRRRCPSAACPTSERRRWSRSRLPSGSRPGSDLTREPVARITSFASRRRSPPLPGVPSSPCWLTRTLSGPSRRPRPCDPGDLVLVDQRLQAGPEPLHDLVAAGGHLDEVDLGVAGELQAEVLRVPDAIGEGGRFEQRLRRDAAAVEARPADLVLVDERDLEPQLGGPERGRVAAGARAEDDEIERVGRADGHGVRRV